MKPRLIHKTLPVTLTDVDYTVGGQVLLRGLSHVFGAGGITVVMGPNGAGKSLLLRLCHGLIRPSRGTITWGRAGLENPRLHQSFVFQHPQFLRRTALQNVEYPLKLRGIEAGSRRARVTEVLEATGLWALRDRAAPLLSGGEQSRLMLARAWVTGPEVMFLDEPTASLDPKASADIEALIADIARDGAREGAKIIMASHDIAQIRRLADDVVFLHQGRLLETGPADSVLANPETPQTRAYINGELVV